MASTRRKSGSNNFTDASYWTLAAAPVSTNDVYFEIGGDTLTLNLSQPGVDLNLLHFGPNSYYNIGTQGGGNPLIIDVNNGGAGQIVNYSLGDWINLQAGTGGTIPLLINNPGNPSQWLYLTTSVVTTLHHLGGNHSIAGTVTGTTLNVRGGYAHVQYTAGNGWTNINIYGGELLLQRDFSGTCTLYGGTVTVNDDNYGITYGAFVVNGDNAVLKHVNGNTGDITVHKGTYDQSGLARSGLTVGTLTIHGSGQLVKSRSIDVTASATSYPTGQPQVSTGGGASVA